MLNVKRSFGGMLFPSGSCATISPWVGECHKLTGTRERTKANELDRRRRDAARPLGAAAPRGPVYDRPGLQGVMYLMQLDSSSDCDTGEPHAGERPDRSPASPRAQQDSVAKRYQLIQERFV